MFTADSSFDWGVRYGFNLNVTQWFVHFIIQNSSCVFPFSPYARRAIAGPEKNENILCSVFFISWRFPFFFMFSTRVKYENAKENRIISRSRLSFRSFDGCLMLILACKHVEFCGSRLRKTILKCFRNPPKRLKPLRRVHTEMQPKPIMQPKKKLLYDQRDLIGRPSVVSLELHVGLDSDTSLIHIKSSDVCNFAGILIFSLLFFYSFSTVWCCSFFFVCDFFPLLHFAGPSYMNSQWSSTRSLLPTKNKIVAKKKGDESTMSEERQQKEEKKTLKHLINNRMTF